MGTGRPRRYCSAACRQRAYRARRRGARTQDGGRDSVAKLAASLRDNAELIVLLSRGWSAPPDVGPLDLTDLVRDTGRLADRIEELTRDETP